MPRSYLSVVFSCVFLAALGCELKLHGSPGHCCLTLLKLDVKKAKCRGKKGVLTAFGSKYITGKYNTEQMQNSLTFAVTSETLYVEQNT